MASTIHNIATAPINENAASTELLLPGQAQPLTTSRLVAEKFGKQHKHVLRDIAELLAQLDEVDRSKFGPIEYTDSKGRMQPEYTMTRDGFLLLAMGFTGKPAMAWKLKFIAAFNALGEQLQRTQARLEWEQARRLEQAAFHDMQQALQETRAAAGKTTARHHFANEARLIGYALTGTCVGLDRESLDADQLRQLRLLEVSNAGLIRAGMSYTDRKGHVRGLGLAH